MKKTTETRTLELATRARPRGGPVVFSNLARTAALISLPLALRRMRQRALHRPVHRPAAALGAVALGAFSLGAFAVGMLAVGRVAVGRAVVGMLGIKRLRIESLEVLQWKGPAAPIPLG